MIETFLAAQPIPTPIGTIGKGEGFGPWTEKIIGGAEPGSILAKIISNVIGAMTIGAGIWFLFQAIIAGYNYLSAGGDKTKIEASGKILTNSLIGIVIVAAAYGLLAILGTFLGIKFLEVGSIFNLITPEKWNSSTPFLPKRE